MRKKIEDGLTKYERYRLKDLEAYRKRKREYTKTPEERAKRNEYMRKWKEKNRDKFNQLCRESHQRNKHKHVHKVRERWLKSRYKMTQADYDKMLEDQNGLCLICNCKESEAARGRFHIDHDHSDGKIRGLLCSRCNGALGWYEKYTNKVNSYLKIDLEMS